MKQSDTQNSEAPNRSRTKIVFLTGLSCSGKSTVGAELARSMKREFIDTDKQIVVQEGQAIPEIFANLGERKFREIESEVIRETVKCCGEADAHEYIIALGGGALMAPANVALVKSAGALALLEVACETAAKRLHGRYDRPLALDDDGELLSLEALKNRLEALLEARSEGFAQADFSVSSSSNSIAATCNSIRNYIESLTN